MVLIYPELAYLSSPRERLAALDRVWNWKRVVAGVLVYVVCQLSIMLVLVGVHFLGLTLIARRLSLSIFGIVYVAVFVLPFLSMHLVVRRRIRRALREQLSKSGIAICPGCAYDLRGSAGRRCPECGSPITRSWKRIHHDEERDVDYVIAPYSPEHRDGIVDVIRAVHDEYGFTWEADGYHRDLYDVDVHYINPGGMFWVVLDGERVIGTAGVTVDGDECELHRMYLLADYRGRGLGRTLLEMTMDYGRSRECRHMVAWSDVKLEDAHRLYRRSGFEQRGERVCDDPDNSRELGFWREPL